MMLTRRKFIQESVIANILLWSLGSFLHGCKKRLTTRNLKVLTEGEFKTLNAVSMVVIPPGGEIPLSAEDVGVAEKIDEFLSDEDDDVKNQVSWALWLFEHAPLLSPKFSRFTSLLPSEQARVVRSWSESRLQIKKQIINTFKEACMFMFYTDPAVWPYIGYDGPWVRIKD